MEALYKIQALQARDSKPSSGLSRFIFFCFLSSFCGSPCFLLLDVYAHFALCFSLPFISFNNVLQQVFAEVLQLFVNFSNLLQLSKPFTSATRRKAIPAGEINAPHFWADSWLSHQGGFGLALVFLQDLLRDISIRNADVPFQLKAAARQWFFGSLELFILLLGYFEIFEKRMDCTLHPLGFGLVWFVCVGVFSLETGAGMGCLYPQVDSRQTAFFDEQAGLDGRTQKKIFLEDIYHQKKIQPEGAGSK